MPQQNKKISKFIAAINSDAENQRKNIEHEIENFNNSELEKAKHEVLEEVHLYMRRESVRIKNNISSEYAERETELKKELIGERNAIARSVFDDATKELIRFTDSPAYSEWFESHLVNALKCFDTDDVVLHVSEKQMQLPETIVKNSDKIYNITEFKPDSNIKIGGFTLVSLSKSLIVDDTLDSHLQSQYDWFLSNSGLTIE